MNNLSPENIIAALQTALWKLDDEEPWRWRVSRDVPCFESRLDAVEVTLGLQICKDLRRMLLWTDGIKVYNQSGREFWALRSLNWMEQNSIWPVLSFKSNPPKILAIVESKDDTDGKYFVYLTESWNGLEVGIYFWSPAREHHFELIAKNISEFLLELKFLKDEDKTQ